jgi:hypothetical protein
MDEVSCSYRVTINGAMRNLPPRPAPDGRRYRPSLPADLHSADAVGEDTEKQQRLLAGACVS